MRTEMEGTIEGYAQALPLPLTNTSGTAAAVSGPEGTPAAPAAAGEPTHQQAAAAPIAGDAQMAM